MSDLSELLTVAHLSWATWAIRSWLLISSERPERFTHSCSFVLSDHSKSLTVAHLIWAKWAKCGNERMNEWAMSKWANSQPWYKPKKGTCRSAPLFRPKSNFLYCSCTVLDLEGRQKGKFSTHPNVQAVLTRKRFFYNTVWNSRVLVVTD